MSDGKLRIAGLGDLHVTETNEHPYRECFAEIARDADVLALCGDLTNLGTIKEAELLAEELRAVPIPMVGVLGNHDIESGHGEQVTKILCQAGLKLLESEPHTIEGIGFAGVKGFAGGFDRGMLGAFGETMIKSFVGEAIAEATKLEVQLKALHVDKVVVLLHYAPIAATCEGEPKEIYPFLGSSRFAETVNRFDNVKAVFHGHAHGGSYEGKTKAGIPVYNVARHVKKPTGKPYAVLEI
ncbi:metallophosphoesterase family protein [Roseiterribacter gracilis]|uniref:Metallophosphoesterase n=1 Tax=Roseiterribacter gracilis TaxID=2812848 RepID=A0A8S8XDR5_9PROT|nr:metallophosphoesterase [Rhodospirillales bacterium TMPK1]